MTSAITPNTSAVTVERVIAASPEAVYRAWLDPEVVRLWMAPGSFELTHVEVDERVGGRYRIWHALGGDPMGGFEAELIELVPPQLLVFRWGFVGPARDDGPVFDSILTITLTPEGEGTRLVLLHEHLDDLAAALPEVAASVAVGWKDVLDKLAAKLEGPDLDKEEATTCAE